MKTVFVFLVASVLVMCTPRYAIWLGDASGRWWYSTNAGQTWTLIRGSGANAPVSPTVSVLVVSQYRQSLTVASASAVTITVHDLSGRMMSSQVQQLTSPGTHDVVVETAGIPAGIYMLTATSASGTVLSRSLIHIVH